MPDRKKPTETWLQTTMDTELVRELRVLAARRGITLKALLAEIFRAYLAETTLTERRA